MKTRLRSKRTSTVDKPPVVDQDCPSVVESDVSSISSLPAAEIPSWILNPHPEEVPKRTPLQWHFRGLTLWLEFEEFNGDLSKANKFLSSKYGTEAIPVVHATAIYGMEHLSTDEAVDLMEKIPMVLPGGNWPMMDPPVAVKQDVSQEGLPGQVCSISWAELTLKSNSDHEAALDALYELFRMERTSAPWTPHMSLAYDNPEESVLQLADVVSCVMKLPTLLQNPRRVRAISLWNTDGKLNDWECLERVTLG